MFYKISEQDINGLIEFMLDVNTSKFTVRAIHTMIQALKSLPKIEVETRTGI